MPDVSEGEPLAPLLIHDLVHLIQLGVPKLVLVGNEVYQCFNGDVEREIDCTYTIMSEGKVD